MKLFFALLLFSSVCCFAQNDSLDYRWPKPGTVLGFYSSYSDFAAGKVAHKGPFVIEHGMGQCASHRPCHFSSIHLSSKVKSQIFPREDVLFASDGTNLFILERSHPGGFGTHLDVSMIQNHGRYGFFERISPAQYAGKKPYTNYYIIDLQSNTIYKASKKNLRIVFKDAPDLLADYIRQDEVLKLARYVVMLNRKLGYLKEKEE